jgi:hypothetical protein
LLIRVIVSGPDEIVTKKFGGNSFPLGKGIESVVILDTAQQTLASSMIAAAKKATKKTKKGAQTTLDKEDEDEDDDEEDEEDDDASTQKSSTTGSPATAPKGKGSKPAKKSTPATDPTASQDITNLAASLTTK